MGSGAHCELSLQVGLISVGAPGEDECELPAHVLPARAPCPSSLRTLAALEWSGLMFTCPTPSISQVGSSCGVCNGCLGTPGTVGTAADLGATP